MRKKTSIDWLTVIIFLALVIFGWMNLYSTSGKEGDTFESIFKFNAYHGKQLIFIAVAFAICGFILLLDTKFIEVTSYIIYGTALFLMLMAVLFARETKGASAWFQIGGLGIQPTEFAKFATLMALAKFMSRYNFSMKNTSDMLKAAGIVALPLLLALLQNDAGSALTFFALILMFYREGLHPLFLVFLAISGFIGILAIFLTDVTGISFIMVAIILLIGGVSLYYFKGKHLRLHILLSIYFCIIPLVVNNVLKPYQLMRFRVLIESEESLKKIQEKQKESGKKIGRNMDVSYHLKQSMVAIGSGGLFGKGYGNATHTKGDFVPEEHTDYIFCVVAEEHGWIGSCLTVGLFFLLLWRITYLAETSKSRYARIYGYGAASSIFFHLMVNIGMTIGLVPTVGIPLPFFSYGGSAVLGFSVMLFILINLHSYRVNILGDKAI